MVARLAGGALVSNVTNAILLCSLPTQLEAFNALLATLVCERFSETEPADTVFGESERFVDVSNHAGGQKVLEATVGLCAFNYLPFDELVAAIEAHFGNALDAPQLLLKTEQDITWSLYCLETGRLVKRFVGIAW